MGDINRNLKKQLAVDVKQQLTVVQEECENQRMVDYLDIDRARREFSRRLNTAADEANWDKRGRAPRLQRELAQRGVKLSVQGVTKWFGAQGMPDRQNMQLVAEIFAVDSAWLVLGVSEMPNNKPAEWGVRESASTSYGSSSLPAEVRIPQYDTGGSGGVGLVLRDQPGVIREWVVDREWLRANVPHHSGIENLAVVTGFGDSMPDVFSPGDPVLIDTGVTECTHDGVYFFRVGDDGYIKRLQMIPSKGIVVISQNPEYEKWTITPDMDFAVLGKVLRAWKGRNY